MLDAVLPHLVCPHCGTGLSRDGGVLRCTRGHTHDIARQGYASLLPPAGSVAGGDTAAMVAARVAFLAAGHHAGIAAAIAGTAAAVLDGAAVPGCVVDVGAGTGHHLAAALERLPERVGVALDASRFALRRAARARPRIGAVACDAWRPLPVADAGAAVVLSVFAPRDAAELRRILHPGGGLVVVTPTQAHLAELVEPLRLLHVDARKDERLEERLGPHFVPDHRRVHRERLLLGHRDVAAAVAMGPSAWHTDADLTGARIAALPDPVTVTLAVTVAVWRPR